MKKKLTSFLLTLCMLLSLLPTAALAAGEFTGGMTAAVNSDVLWLFANGTAVTIAAKGTGTAIYADNGGTPTEIDLATVTAYKGDKKLTNNGDNGYDLSAVVVCGGSQISSLNRDTHVTMNGGTVGTLVGGCYGGTLTGSTYVTVTGGTLSGCISVSSKRSLIGGSFITSGNPSISGDTHVTITGGTFSAASLVGSAGSSDNPTSVNNAYLTLKGGSFTDFWQRISSGYSCTYSGGVYYYVDAAAPLPSALLKTGEDTNGGAADNRTAYVLSNQADDLFYTTAYGYNAGAVSTVKIDETNKTYTFSNVDKVSTGTSYTIPASFSIPAGYKLEIPKDVILTVPAGVTVDNSGAISIKGKLTNNGIISGSGSIVKVGSGGYTGGTPATDAVKSSVEGFTTLTIEKGTTAGTTKLTGVDAVTQGNTQYYKYVYGTEPAAPESGATWTNTGDYTQLTATPVDDIPAVVGYSSLVVCEVDSSNNYVKYGCVPLTADNVKAATLTDLSTAVTGGEGTNSTKITATAASGNSLYYTFSDTPTSGLYNMPVRTGGLTAVTSGKDISAEAGKYLVVYELSNTKNADDTYPLRGFACVKLEGKYYTGFTGGLVADTQNKIIYCNGATVCLSTGYDEIAQRITEPRLYVLDADGTTWKAATPKNLDFSAGDGYAAYTLSGKKDAADTAAKGTLYLLRSKEYYNINSTTQGFNTCLPAGATDFANAIVPEKTALDSINNYTVVGTIDPSKAKLNHLLSTTLSIDKLTVADGGKFIIPTKDESGILQPSDVLKVAFTGGKENITGTTENLVCAALRPQVDFKLLQKDGTEFPKDNGIYQIPSNKQVTIVAAFGADKPTASASPLPEKFLGTPTAEDNVSTSDKPTIPGYTLSFRQTASGGNTYSYQHFSGDKLDVKYSGGADGARVTTVALTLSSLKDYKGMELLAFNQNITDGGDGQIPPRYVDNMAGCSFTVTKGEQAAITATIPANVTYGGAGFNLNAKGGSGSGIYTYDSTVKTVATVDTSGNVTIVGAGETTIEVTRAGDNDYEPRTDTFTLTVAKKAPVAADLTLSGNSVTYDGNPKAVTVAAASGVTGLGTVSKIYYTGVSPTVYTISETAPTNAGTYQITVDAAEGTNYKAATGLAVGTLTIAKAENIAAPTNGVVDDVNNTFAFAKTPTYNEYQFSLDGGTTWADCVDTDSDANTITIKVGNIAGKVKVRVKETENVVGQALESSTAFTAALEGSVAVTGTAKYGETLTATVTGAQKNAVFTYVWKADGTKISGETDKTLLLTNADFLGKKITVEVTASPYTGTLKSTETAAVAKGDPKGAPAYTAITASDKTFADANLEIGTLKPNDTGYTLKWVDDKGAELPGTTKVAANTAYKWLFTPKDTTNYNTLTGSITLYTVSTGGGGGGSVIPTEQPPKIDPPITDNGTTSVTAAITPSVIGNSASAAVSSDTMDKALSSAVEAAKETGTQAKVEIKVDAPQGAATVNTKLPAGSLESIAASGASLSVDAGVAAVELSAATMSSVAKQAGSESITLTVATVKPENLTPEQQQTIGSGAKDGTVIDLNLNAGGKKISDLGGSVTVSIPVKSDNGTPPEQLKVWFLAGDGSITPCTGHYDAKSGCYTFTTDHFSAYALVKFPFTDVADNAWYYGSIAYAYMNKLFSGTSDTTFAPEAAMTRAMLVTVLWRMEGEPAVNYAMQFDDVTENQWYSEAIRWAAANKIVEGAGTSFMPNDSITREQLVTILYRYAEYKGTTVSMDGSMGLAGYDDAASISAYAQNAMLWAAKTGLVQGSAGKLMPQINATRAQVAAIIERFKSTKTTA